MKGLVLLEDFSTEIRRKAEKLLASGKVCQDADYDRIYWMPSSSGHKKYRVQTDYDRVTGDIGWITCTCPHGLNKGAGQTRCYHAAAVLLLLTEGEKDGTEGEKDGDE